MSDESKGCPIQAGDYVRVVEVPPAHEEDFQLGEELVVESVRTALWKSGAMTWLVCTPKGDMFIDRFEKIDWVDITDPDHVLDEKTDWVRHEGRGYGRGWERVDGLHGRKWGSVDKSDFPQARCRRKDLPKVEPERPVEVHAGGPYVARSVHEQVCVERDALQKQVENLGRDVDILKGFNRELKQHGTSFELLEKLKAAEDKLAVQTRDMLWMTGNQDKVISSQRDRIAGLIDRLGKMCNHEQPRVSCNEEGRVYLYKGALPAGWWYGFDSEGRWWGCSVRPRPTKYGWWEVPPGQTGDWQKLEGMPEADKSTWGENCWQVM